MSDLNEFHQKNWQRMHEVFAPAHGVAALVLCVGEEVGELCGAVLGVTGEKKRKAYLTNADVLDACADAATYLSLLMYSAGAQDLERILAAHCVRRPVGSLAVLVAHLQRSVGHLADESLIGDDLHDIATLAARAFSRSEHIAIAAGCSNWGKLLGDTFNMVSERAGSPIRTRLGQVEP